jgi:hypothetical protein
MKKIASVAEVSGKGMEALLGERVMLLCLNYIYSGVLEGVNSDCVLLADPSIVYETGEWSAKQWKDAQRLPCEKLYVNRRAIESFGIGK